MALFSENIFGTKGWRIASNNFTWIDLTNRESKVSICIFIPGMKHRDRDNQWSYRYLNHVLETNRYRESRIILAWCSLAWIKDLQGMQSPACLPRWHATKEGDGIHYASLSQIGMLPYMCSELRPNEPVPSMQDSSLSRSTWALEVQRIHGTTRLSLQSKAPRNIGNPGPIQSAPFSHAP